ncbi:hypothetical protein [Fretibacter rubidus]|uniref:hypothetical protein n=1 Tax=Fretibacter rubidus TaxID=570162 RepID=UPI00352B3666
MDGAYTQPLVIRRDGLRWRDIGTGFNSGKLTSGFAAYDLALLNYCALGGPQDFRAFKRNMKIAAEKKIYNSRDIVARMNSRQTSARVGSKSSKIENLISAQMQKRSNEFRPVFKACLG